MSLILIDGSALFYRSHFAFARNPLTSPTGELTSVAYGFFNGILRLVDTYRPEKLVVVFDVKGPNFRHEMYDQYKAHRKPMPPELAEQLPRLEELLKAWGVTVLRKKGFEADDVMATIARQSVGHTDQVWFYTGDKDFMQLLDERTGMLKPGRRGEETTTLTDDKIRKIYGINPKDLIDVFALAGDKADNIPGAPGVGDKTALKLIKEFGTLEALFEGLEKSSLTPRLKRILSENKDQVFLSRELFIMKDDVVLDLDWEAMTTTLPTSPEVTELLHELGLRRIREFAGRLSRKLGLDAKSMKETTSDIPAKEIEPLSWKDRLVESDYVNLDDDDSLRRWLGRLDPNAPLAIDTETDSLRRESARLVGISLAGTDLNGAALPSAYIPVLWRTDGDPGVSVADSLFPAGQESNRLTSVRQIVAPFLADPRSLKVGQNLKFDEWILSRHGFPLAGHRFDTMVASYLIDPGRRSHGLDDLVLEFLDHTMMPYSSLFAKGDRLKDILAVESAKLAFYAAEDAAFTYKLFKVMQKQLEDSGMVDLFNNMEMPISGVLLEMEQNGIKIDRKFLSILGEKFKGELGDLTSRIHDLAGEPFNVQSPKQLAHILFEKLGFKPLKKTASGWSTDVGVLTQMSEEHELPGIVLEYRKIAKLQNTYVEVLPKLAVPETGLIHTSYNQAVTATGRLSSSDPNLQNIPIRTGLGREIRRAFIPRLKDNVFLSADYSQVELRLLAHLADDPGLQEAFNGKIDVHRRTAALIAGVPEKDVTDEMRSNAKAINFGVIYGMGARALGRQIGVKTKEAAAFIETYFETYPGVKTFIEETKAQAHERGWVETLLGRRRLLPDIGSSNNRIRSFQERVAVNTPIQGTAADLIKLAMLRISDSLQKSDTGALLLLQVHDELVLEVPVKKLPEVEELVKVGMEGAMELKVPLVVDMHSGENWAEAHG